MPTRLDNRLPGKVQSLLAKYGAIGTVYFPADSGTYAPGGTGSVTGDPVGITIKLSPPEPYLERFIDGQNIQSGDAKVYLAARDTEKAPEPGYKVVLSDGSAWMIVGVETIMSGELVVAYALQIRR